MVILPLGVLPPHILSSGPQVVCLISVPTSHMFTGHISAPGLGVLRAEAAKAIRRALPHAQGGDPKETEGVE